MGKLALAALLTLATVASGGNAMDNDEQPAITISPMPPHEGEQITITYTGPLPVTLELDWDPAAQPDKVNIGSSGSGTVTVPAGSTSLVVTDPTPGGANYVSTVILP